MKAAKDQLMKTICQTGEVERNKLYSPENRKG